MTIKKTNNGCDDFDPKLQTIDDAVEKILGACHSINVFEPIEILSALNRVLYDDVVSTINVPAHTNSAMDGYAINGRCLQEDLNKVLRGNEEISLSIVGTVMAGAPIDTEIQSGQCARIMTGGKMPVGTDTVIMQEHVKLKDNNIIFNNNHHPGQNVRHAGEDIAIGATVLKKGKRLSPADIGLLASIGIAQVNVYKKVRVAFFSTGDELCTVGNKPADGQIYDSNRYTLHCMLQQFGAEIIDMGVIADDRQRIEDAFIHASQQADVLITTGGVSVGEADFVKLTLEKLGSVNFWKVAMKPGKPLAFGHINDCLFFGLPGNPVSAMVTFYQFVTPALIKMSGRDYQKTGLVEIPCSTSLKKAPGRAEFQRGIIETDEMGRQTVRSTGQQGSGILSSMSKANCFILLPLETSYIEKGTLVKVQRFDGLV